MEYQPDGSAGSVTLRLRSRIVDLGEANSLNYNNLPYIVSRPPPFGPAIAFPGAEFVSPLATGTPMLFGLVDRVTSASPLKAALDRSVERTRGIAERVSQATLNNGDGFSLEAKNGTAANANQNPVNVEDEMIALADEQLRFLATSRLLEKTYASLRSAIRGNGAA